MFENRTVAYLNAKEEAVFLDALKTPKYLFIALLLDDCFMRVSEAVSLKVKDFNFQGKLVYVKSLKKRGKKNVVREVPMTRRVLDAAAAYWQTLKEKPKADDYIFPAGNGAEEGHASRKTVWAVFKKKGGVNPHKLRHTGATRLIENGVSILVARDLLGHDSSRVTEVYTHTSRERAQNAVASIERSTLYERVKTRLFPDKKIFVLPLSVGVNKYYVGREVEISRLHELTDKRVNVLNLGSQGIGKSALTDNFTYPKLIRIDDTKDFKKVLANMVLHLAQGDKADLAMMMNLDSRPECITKLSVKANMLLLTQLTEPQEYTLVIDDVTNVTKASIPTLEALRGHFHMIVNAREIPIAMTSWLTNFERLRLEPLKRPEALKLITLQSEDFKANIEDVTAFQTAVYSATNGNPLAIVEMVQRWRVEGYVRADSIQAITHTSARSERNFAPVILGVVAICALWKFYLKEASEADKEAGMLFGGAAILLLMFSGKIGSAVRTRFVR